MTPSEQMRSMLRASGLTRREAAERLGVSVDTVRSWLRPARSPGHREPRGSVLLLARQVLR